MKKLSTKNTKGTNKFKKSAHCDAGLSRKMWFYFVPFVFFVDSDF